MRILVSNPDTLGDMVLRQPFYDALIRDGHELMLIVRQSVAPLVPYVAPGARIVSVPTELYRDDLAGNWEQLSSVFDAARAFEPDRLVIAPYQWTLFEEKLAAELAGVFCVGMSGRLYRGDPHAGRSPLSTMRLDSVALVEENAAEVEKNEALASVILGRTVHLGLPRLQAEPTEVEAAKQDLQRRGLNPDGFWLAGVAGTKHVPLKKWHARGWGDVLTYFAQEFGKRSLFVGLPIERPIFEQVQSAMPADGKSLIFPDEEMSLARLIAVTSLAGGYIGHDTGPMHLAASMGKPVLALFGGGHWPRFVPAVEPGCSITVGVPCVGCGWMCAFREAHCISDIPVEDVKLALNELLAGKIRGRDLRVLSVAPSVKDRMVCESAATVREQRRELAEVARELHDENQKAAASDAMLKALADRFQQRMDELSETRSSNSAKALEAQIASHAEQIRALESRIAQLEWSSKPAAPVKERWSAEASRWMEGNQYFVPRGGFRTLPSISIVIVLNAADRRIDDTIESVLGQNYPKLECVVVADANLPQQMIDQVEAYRDRLSQIIAEPVESTVAAIARGISATTGNVIGYLTNTELLEPGSLMRVGECFRDHIHAKVVYGEATININGWRFPGRMQPQVDVYDLLKGHEFSRGTVFFRDFAYRAVGGLNHHPEQCAEWALLIRLSRMWRLRRAAGHISSSKIIARRDEADRAEKQQAEQKFLSTFGLPGRLRCRAIQVINWIRNGVEFVFSRRRFYWPSENAGDSLPPVRMPLAAAGELVSFLSGRAPDRFLFSRMIECSGQGTLQDVYFESSLGLAIIYPPPPCDEQDTSPCEAIAGEQNYYSPFRSFRGGGILGRMVSALPCPLSVSSESSNADSERIDDVLRVLRGVASPSDAKVRFLQIDCSEGGLLDDLKKRTKWQLFGFDAGSQAVEAASAKGYQVWQGSVEDAPLVTPIGTEFDVIYLGDVLGALEDPLTALQRLKMLLSLNGVIVIGCPNLDSWQADLFGPTWGYWRQPRLRTMLTRAALRRLASLAGMKTHRLRTRTYADSISVSVRSNQVGLARKLPDDASLTESDAVYGKRLTGWSRLLWDWRGRGDYMFSVLRRA